MAGPLGPTGRQIPDHSLTLKDLPAPPGPGFLLVADENGNLAFMKPAVDTLTGTYMLDNEGNIIYYT